MLRLLKKASITYLAFGLGVIVGSIIASVVASFLILATMDSAQLERLNEIAEDLKD